MIPVSRKQTAVDAQGRCRNLILSRLDPADFALLGDDLEPVRWAIGTTLVEAEDAITHVFFPEDGIISVIAATPNAQSSEIGIVGGEGLVSSLAILGAERSPHQMRLQTDGHGHRIPGGTLLAAAERSPRLHRTLSRFALVMIVQTSSTALSNAVHSITVRLARWLLMCHDRSSSDDLSLTHDFMALMLSVRRPSVTNALHTLEGAGFIRADRGCVLIRNRAALEEFAADAYGRAEWEYRQHLGPLS